ncbi:MAG: ferredoxin--NADP reductase [Nakamurella sp.]
MRSQLDSLLGRVTMYRLVVYCLALLAVLAVIFGFTGAVSFAPRAMLTTLVVLLIVGYLGNRLFAVLFRVTPHSESSVITALLLFFILQPTTDPTMLLQIALAALFASGSKYVLAVRGRHIFNPAAVGAVWLTVFHFYLALWWVGSPILVGFTAVLALLVMYRTRRVPVGALFVLLAAIIMVSRNLMDGTTFVDSLKYVFTQTPLVFLAGFMLTEPLTLPPARWQQLSVAAVVAVLFAIPITIGTFAFGPETALIVGNAVAFLFGQRRGIELAMTAKRSLTPSSMEFVFRPTRGLAFTPGQYLELTVPHRSMDSRGARRAFSIASAPADADAVKIGIKIAAEKGSSFKRALCELDVGDTVRATGIAGDFRLPKDTGKPLLLVAGGIGITPFVSQLAALDPDHRRDIVVVYASSNPAEVGYTEILQRSGARVIVVSKTAAAGLPTSFQNVTAARLGAAELQATVPDIRQRHVYISGSPALVDDIGGIARKLKAKSIKKDYFSGY